MNELPQNNVLGEGVQGPAWVSNKCLCKTIWTPLVEREGCRYTDEEEFSLAADTENKPYGLSPGPGIYETSWW